MQDLVKVVHDVNEEALKRPLSGDNGTRMDVWLCTEVNDSRCVLEQWLRRTTLWFLEDMKNSRPETTLDFHTVVFVAAVSSAVVIPICLCLVLMLVKRNRPELGRRVVAVQAVQRVSSDADDASSVRSEKTLVN